ncbi:NlpC/P60 family protein [Nocardia sp. NPDC024068]|uniref:C40 family peptidase n=1 Tax=Nocardia sp. NPDC024068 TaxID=3157197 RepID=UPI0034056C35
MTSAEIGPYPIEVDAEGEEQEDGVPGAGTPWAVGERRRWGGSNNGQTPGAPGVPAGPAAPNPSATPVANSTPAPGSTSPAPSSAAAVPVAGAVPAVGSPVAAQPSPSAAPAGQSAAAPAPATGADHGRTDPLVGPEMLAQLAPTALMAGSTLLPMLGSALSGLLGGGGSGGGATAPVAESGETGMAPDTARAMRALKALEALYGEGEPTDPEVKKLREEIDGSKAGAGAGPAMVKAKQLYQKNAANAFNNLDKQLATYISGVAGTNTIDKGAVRSLLKSVNEALAELGTTAYTKEGQQKVRQILTVALKAAHQIVSGGSAKAGDTASAIDQLTNQYLYNILGKEPPGGVKFAAAAAAASGAGGSERAQFAVKTALAQVGDPYVWGAEGPGSFDCSGLTQYAAGKAGVSIPRVADDQYRKLPRVNPGDIRPGDLIFPASSYKNGKMGHVMMYIGDGRCVHAPRTGRDITTTSLPNSYAAARFA